jgi:hypothetical protein
MRPLRRSFRSVLRSSVAAVGLVLASRAVSFAISPGVNNLQPPALYVIEGYLDRAPEKVEIRDRIDIVVQGRQHSLLVTRYGMPGEIGLDRYLSRVMTQPFAIVGTSEEVGRLGAAPSGTRVVGTFAAYTQGAPRLRIAELTEPAPPS